MSLSSLSSDQFGALNAHHGGVAGHAGGQEQDDPRYPQNLTGQSHPHWNGPAAPSPIARGARNSPEQATSYRYTNSTTPMPVGKDSIGSWLWRST